MELLNSLLVSVLKVIVIAIVLLISFSLFGQQDFVIRLKTTEPTLTTSPNICELTSDKRTCATTVALIWEVPRAGNFCIYREKSKTTLACWQGKWSGVYQHTFSSTKSEKFWLIREDTKEKLISTEVKVIGAIEQRVRIRRRNGFWRIF